jgi:hypothetical protein
VADAWVVEVEVGLVRVEPVPVVCLGHRVPRPVRRLKILEDDPDVTVLLGIVAPDVVVPPAPARPVATSMLEPGVLVRGVVHDQLGDHSQAAAVSLTQERLEVPQRAVGGMNRGEVGDVVAVVLAGRGAEREEPERGDAELLQVVEALGQAPEVAGPVPVAVHEGAHV